LSLSASEAFARLACRAGAVLKKFKEQDNARNRETLYVGYPIQAFADAADNLRKEEAVRFTYEKTTG